MAVNLTSWIKSNTLVHWLSQAHHSATHMRRTYARSTEQQTQCWTGCKHQMNPFKCGYYTRTVYHALHMWLAQRSIHQDMTDCTTALNDAIRKIFTFQRWESVRALREGFGYKSLVEIFARANNKFLNSLPSHYNCTISRLHTFTTNAMKSDWPLCRYIDHFI